MTTQNLEEFFFELGQQDDPIPASGQAKGVTVRLPIETVCELDAFANVTGMSRQNLLQTLITGGLKTAMNAYFDVVSTDKSEEYAMINAHLREQAGIDDSEVI